MTMASEKVPMLAEGHRQINDEVKRLKIERPEVIEAIEAARAHGDLSENAEYHAAKERQGQIEAIIADIEDRLSRAMVIDPTTLSGDKVVFGATVTLIDEDKKKVRYQLVGQTEADAKVGRISYNSPLGRALIGRQMGEEVEVTTPPASAITRSPRSSSSEPSDAADCATATVRSSRLTTVAGVVDRGARRAIDSAALRWASFRRG